MTKTNKRLYMTREIRELSALDDRQIQFVVDNGVIPLAEGGGKRGVARKFSEQSAKEFLIVAELIKFGITIGVIKNFIEDLRRPFLGGDRLTSSSINTVTGEEVHPYILFWVDSAAEGGYMAKFEPSGLKELLNDIKELGRVCFLIIDLNQINSKI
jgi:hypothetical protein